MSFSPAVINILRKFGKEQSYDAGYPIVRRGEKGQAFYVIISGNVEVRLSADDAFHFTLACLGPGEKNPRLPDSAHSLSVISES